MLDFRINTFLTVCRHMNYTKAAAELSMTQPAASQHVRCIEDHFKIKAFAFEGKKMFLTPEGSLLRDALSTMQHDEEHLQEVLQRSSPAKLSFGATLTAGEFLIEDRLSRYIKNRPEVSVRVTMANTSELLDMLDDGVIDIAIVEGYYPKSRYDHLLYSRENYIGICSSGRRWEKPHLTMDDLISETLISREPGSGTREILERSLELADHHISDFQRLIEINNIGIIKHLVESGCGISFIYEAAVKTEIEKGSLKKIPLEDFSVTHDISFIWRKGSMFSAEYHAVFDSLL